MGGPLTRWMATAVGSTAFTTATSSCVGLKAETRGPTGPDRPAEAAAEPPSEGKGGLKQVQKSPDTFVLGAGDSGSSCW